MKIFVGGLPKDITNEELSSAFEDFGDVSSANIVTDKKTGISRSYGFVEMPDKPQALRAIEALHEAIVDGQTISVKAGVDPLPVKKGKPKGGGGKFIKKPFKLNTRNNHSEPPPKTGGKRKRNAGYNPNPNKPEESSKL